MTRRKARADRSDRRRRTGWPASASPTPGPGLAPEVAEQLFQPFVTTKRHGMGVGLSISRTIIEAHGGRIGVESNPDGGATFHFTLSAVTKEESPMPTEGRCACDRRRRRGARVARLPVGAADYAVQSYEFGRGLSGRGMALRPAASSPMSACRR